MPHICPSPCSRLATAAVFISVGVVQFVVGIILLRSKYVFLLAGPDFWTACSNIAVGCLLGVSASVWKHSRKRQSTKQVVRRNVLVSLLLSALIINATTLGILLLSEGNTLLSIRLESEGIYSNITFVSEVLAYAYATSVCSPIVCIVVSIVAMAGSCFGYSARKTSMETPQNSGRKVRSQSFQWVYTPEMLALAKNKGPQIVLASSSDSSSDETPEKNPPRPKYVNSVEDLQRVLHRMAEGKRDSIMSDSTVMLQQLDLRRKNRYNSLNQDGSYVGPILVRTKESALSERKCNSNDSVNHERSSYIATNPRIYRNSVVYDGNTARVSYGDVTLERIIPPRKQPPNTLHRNEYTAEEERRDDYENSSQLVPKNSHAKYRNFRESLQVGSEMGGSMRSLSSEDVRPKFRNTASVHRVSTSMHGLENDPNDYSLKRKHELSFDSPEIIEKENCVFGESSNVTETVSPTLNDCFSPDGSEFGVDSFDISRASSWAGEVIPISVSNSSVARLSHKLVPVSSPVVPNSRETNLPKRSKSEILSTSGTEDVSRNILKGERKDQLFSFRENTKARNKDSITEYPKVGQQSAKKYDLARVITMTSISEEPNTEENQPSAEATRATLHQETAGASSMPTNHLNKKSLSTAYSESSREINQDRGSPGRETTPKRKTSASCKSLKRLWSSNIAREMDLKDVDEDSLIGLSEEELIARQNRIRSIRKAVQQRIKIREMAI